MTTNGLAAIICVCAVLFFWTSHAGAQLYRMDDFELLAPDTTIDGTAANGDPAGPGVRAWDTHGEDTSFMRTWLDPAGSPGIVLRADGWSGGNRACCLAHTGSSGYIIDTEPAKNNVGELGTLFVRFYVDSADPNVQAYLGISSASSIGNADISRVNAGVVVYNDPVLGLGIYQQVGSGSMAGVSPAHIRVKDLDFDTWYNLWVVADRRGETVSIEKYDAYLNTGGADATAGDIIIDDADFSNVNQYDLKGFYATCQAASDFLYIDDVYMDDDAESLANPVTPWGGVSYPSPADGEQLDTTEVTFQWKAGVDPTNTDQPNPAVTNHYLYIVPIPPEEVTDWAVYRTDVPVSTGADAVVSYGPVSLNPNKTYWWVVDEIISPTEKIYGRVWSFETLKTTPEILSGPNDALVGENETATITIDVNNPSGVTYAWYEGVSGDTTSPVVGAADSNVLTIANAQVADEGFYWCRLTNVGGSIDSSEAALVIKRALAHWTMDEADYVGGQYRDISGNEHHATVVGEATFVADVNGAAASAAEMSFATGGYAEAGTWDPSALSGSLGVSAWIKPADIGTGAGIVTKRGSWGEDTMRWVFNYHTENYIRFITYTGGAVYSEKPAPLNEWTHAACTFDAGTGTARVYFNGELSGTDTDAALDSNDLSIVRIGQYDDTVSDSDVFDGAMDDVRIYNHALSNDEVANLYYDVTKEPVCSDKIDPRFDLNSDCVVDFKDYAIFVSHWLDCGLYPADACN
jgi:hypothetical protein